MISRAILVAFLLVSVRLQAVELDFRNEIAPLLSEKCLACHNGREQEGNLDLSTSESAFAGGDSGAEAIVPGKLGESFLWERVSGNEMPPEHPLSDAEKLLLREWIEQGAVWDGDGIDPFEFSSENRAGYDWWSLQPLVRPKLPADSDDQHPIDVFIRAELGQRGLVASTPADRRTLIRRLSFDLLGLPPTSLEVDRFLADRSLHAWESLVDRTLASPRYGERWARHWLDLARFGESHGFERDRIRNNAWPYRDWVIKAMNDDMPFNRFASLQIAGDVIGHDDANGLAATGFLVAGPYDEVGQTQQSAAMREVVRQDEMEDYVGTVCQTFLGLTVNCARCHDHKFDPITQTDYYRLAAALAGVKPGNRRWNSASNERDIQVSEQGKTVYAVSPVKPAVTRVLLRGNSNSPAEEVVAAGIPSLEGISPDFGIGKEASDAQRRTELARWITDERNPLFARVIVNRLWHYHFGVGIVSTPNDFGFNGARPTHPELLDYLALYLIDHDWSMKAVHRLIVTSQTYQQSSKPMPQALKVDAGNQWLWRYAPQRMQGEVIRDSMLTAARTINPRYGGESYRNFDTFNSNSQFYVMKDKTERDAQRRTIYRMWIRSGRNRLLDAFDCPDPSVTTPDRAITTTPTQSLSMLNNAFVLRMADDLHDNIVNDGYEKSESQVRMVYRRLFQRMPRSDELALASEFVEEHGLSPLVRVLFNTNEFLFIE